MRTIEVAGQYRRDYKRELKGRYGHIQSSAVQTVLDILVSDQPLDSRYRDHALVGNWRGCRECHVKPDLLLIYRLTEGDGTKDNPDGLHLVRLGSHSGLGSYSELLA